MTKNALTNRHGVLARLVQSWLPRRHYPAPKAAPLSDHLAKDIGIRREAANQVRLDPELEALRYSG
jgi:hypothetical protein